MGPPIFYSLVLIFCWWSDYSRKSYTPPTGGADPGAPRTLFELLYYGPAQFGGCAFSFFVHFFLFFFILL
jgi:hypothetical protein